VRLDAILSAFAAKKEDAPVCCFSRLNPARSRLMGIANAIKLRSDCVRLTASNLSNLLLTVNSCRSALDERPPRSHRPPQPHHAVFEQKAGSISRHVFIDVTQMQVNTHHILRQRASGPVAIAAKPTEFIAVRDVQLRTIMQCQCNLVPGPTRAAVIVPVADVVFAERSAKRHPARPGRRRT
jgi:hypothetical protein